MSIPEGFKLVPAEMHLDREVIGAINFHCGDGGDNFGDHTHGLLWVGAMKDDEGKEVYGLHLLTAEYPEEGSTTLVEFDAPTPPQPIYDEAKERELFEAFYSERAKTLPLPLGNPIRYGGGQYVNDFALFGWMVWLACAQSRAGSGVDAGAHTGSRSGNSVSRGQACRLEWVRG